VTVALQIRNWTQDGDITTVVCTCGGLAELLPDVRRPIPPYTSAKCQRCGIRWRLESVNATNDAECIEAPPREEGAE